MSRLFEWRLGLATMKSKSGWTAVIASTHFHLDGAKTEKVPVTTLEHFMEDWEIQQIDLLKLDCEGAEWDILPASVEILPKIRQICMEFHLDRGWTAEKLGTWLRNHGYEVIHTPGVWNGQLWARRPRSESLPDPTGSGHSTSTE